MPLPEPNKECSTCRGFPKPGILCPGCMACSETGCKKVREMGSALCQRHGFLVANAEESKRIAADRAKSKRDWRTAHPNDASESLKGYNPAIDERRRAEYNQ